MMEWILINGALCLSMQQDICIHQGNAQFPFTLTSPVDDELPYWTLDSAKAAGEKKASELGEFKK